MRKTILTVACALFALATISANKKVTTNFDLIDLTTNVDKEINSFCKAIINGDVETVKKYLRF